MTASQGSDELAALTDEYLARLRAQLAEAVAVAKAKHEEAAQAARYAAKVESAVRSVEALQVDETSVVILPPPPPLTEADEDLLASFIAKDGKGETAQPPSKLVPYVPAGGTRLKSKRMLFDLMKALDRPVTRDELRQHFFEYFGRDELSQYWKRPDNALNTAIDRAIADEYILPVPIRTDGDETRYTVGWEDALTGEPAIQDEGDDD